MQKLSVCALVLISICICTAQNLPSDRLLNWTQLPLQKNNNYSNYIPTDIGLKPNDTAFDNSIPLNNFLTIKKNSGFVKIIFDAKTYYFKGVINLIDSILLVGKGADSTQLIFNTKGTNHLFSISGSSNKITDTISANITRNSNVIVLKNRTIKTGEYFLLNQPDDGRITSSWASGSIGQILQAKSVANDSIYIAASVNLFYKKNEGFIAKINSQNSIGMECFSIIRQDASAAQHSNFDYNYVSNAWFVGVKSSYCMFAHVALNTCYNVQINACHFQHSWDYGGGGRGYGIAMSGTTSTCVIENSYFKHLRHSVLLQSGSNGNIIAYNTSQEPYWTQVLAPSNSSGEFVCHGNFAYGNLAEGNIFGNFVLDNSHGINGPLNTLFRNRGNLYGIFMNSGAGDSFNYIGNELVGSTALNIQTGKGNFSFRNNLNGSVNNSEIISESSLYRKSNPNYLSAFPWPLFGNNFNVNSNAVSRRIVLGDTAICDVDGYHRLSVNKHNLHNIHLMPNPFSSFIKIDGLNENYQCKIYNAEGKNMQFCISNNRINTEQFKSGLYILQIIANNQIKNYRFLKLHE